jgi:UDP-N-acetylglucosamine 2-epimerase (non-hydrolysing)
VFFDDLGLPAPDLNLGVGSGSHAEQTAAVLVALESALADRDPSLVVVYGDVNSTLAAALVAAKMWIPLAHVEAGLRSFDRSMPEEINRLVTDALATHHFVTSPEAVTNLAAEGIKGNRVHYVGNPMIDSLMLHRGVVELDGLRRALELPETYGLVTLHRPSNVDDGDVVRGIVEALDTIGRDLPLVFPVHPRGRRAFESAGLRTGARLRVVEPLGYREFVALMEGARLVITDSGGIQEETTVLGTPCLTIRSTTERPITVTQGTNRLVGNDPGTIVSAAHRVLSEPRPSPRHIPLWDGAAGQRIAEILRAAVMGTTAQSRTPKTPIRGSSN